MKITKEQFKKDYKSKYFYHEKYGMCQITAGFAKSKEITKNRWWLKKKEVIGTEYYLQEIEILYMNKLGDISKGYLSDQWFLTYQLPMMMEAAERIIKSYTLLKS